MSISEKKVNFADAINSPKTDLIQIDKHIEILLLNNDCVIVPGLGGFMAHHECAQYNADSQTFTPPLRQLGFNSQLTINDSLLAQSYIEAYDISYPEAIRRIESEVTELRQMLNHDGRCELNGIGSLMLNSDGKIEYEPCGSGILTPDFYGLNIVNIKPLVDSVAPIKTVTEKQERTTIGNHLNSEAPQPAPELSIVHENTDDVVENSGDENESTISIKISTLKYISAAACALALFMFALPFGQSTQPELTKSYMDTGILYNILPDKVKGLDTTKQTINFVKEEAQADSIANTSNLAESGNADTKLAVNKIAEPKSQISDAKPEKKHFFSIVLVSSTTKSNAQHFIAKLKEGGYDKAEMIERSNGTKVIYGHFNTEQEAQTFLRNLRNSAEHFSDGWVMEFNKQES